MSLEPRDAVSPDGKFEATALGTRRLTPVAPASRSRPGGTRGAGDVGLWSLDGKSITAEDAQGLVPQYDAASDSIENVKGAIVAGGRRPDIGFPSLSAVNTLGTEPL